MNKIIQLSEDYLDGKLNDDQYYVQLVVALAEVFIVERTADNDDVSRIAAALADLED